MSLNELKVKNLRVERGSRSLFQALNFTVEAGEVLQVLGHNGVGKSSLLRVLAGLRAPEEGAVYWNTKNIAHSLENYQQQLSYLGHHLGLKANLTILENLQFHSTELKPLLAQLSLLTHQQAFIATLSQGQKQRVALARVFLAHKKLWILDEPFAALDHQAFELVQSFIQQHLAQEGIVVLSSHRPLEFTEQVKTLRLEGKNNG